MTLSETHTDKQLIELRSIFHLFKLIAYKFQNADLVHKKDFLTNQLSEHSIDDSVIVCDKDTKGRITLVIEGKELCVNSYLLTSNSPVFKAMLQSLSFKEGLNRRIELPGKKFIEVVYFLQFLQSLQDINGMCMIVLKL